MVRRCSKCKFRRAEWRCGYRFRGKRAGEVCGRILCSQCAGVFDQRRYCCDHIDGAAKRVAELEADKAQGDLFGKG